MENTPLTRAKIYDRCKDDFALFVEHVIGLNNEPFHDEIDRALGNPMHKKIAISFPRGHGKSTHLSVAYPLWRIAKDHNLRILLVSATAQVSQSFMTEMIGHIERNAEYQAFALHIDPYKKGVVPKMKNYAKMRENWSGGSIVVEREDLNLKDPTINAVGLFGSILSKRADIIIGDDIVNQENSATESQRQKTIDWIYTTVLPVLIPGGTFAYLGNTWHVDDLVARLLKDPQFDFKQKMPAIKHESIRPDLWEHWAGLILDEQFDLATRRAMAEAFYNEHHDLMMEGVEVLWPSRYPYKELYLMRMANSYAFARMYQCDPSNRPDQDFKEEWLEMALKKGELYRLQENTRDGFTFDITTEGVDLAISEDSRSDDTVLLTIDHVLYSKDPNIRVGDIFLRNIVRGKMSPSKVREAIKHDYEVHRPNGIRVETVGYQEAIKRDLDEQGIPVRGYKTGVEKRDPFMGINRLAVLFENGRIILPFDISDQRTYTLITMLLNELRAYPDGHTGDSLMALWFAHSEMLDIIGDRILVPMASGDPVNVDPPDMSTPELRAPLEKKADQAMILEQQAELDQFRQMMGGFWRG